MLPIIPKYLPKKSENPLGLHQRYRVFKVDETKQELQPVDNHSEYFPLRLDLNAPNEARLRAARIAVHAYADAIDLDEPDLAADIRKRWPLDFSDLPLGRIIPAIEKQKLNEKENSENEEGKPSSKG